MFASLTLFALSGIMPLSPAVGQPFWFTDYGVARYQGVTANKPLMVVIGSGKNAWDAMSKEGGWSKEVQQLLVQNYICVYVDSEDEKGKELASAFEIAATGLVISNRDGSIQAFRHEGSISNEHLERYLDRYADPFFVARATETPLQERSSYYYQAPGSYLSPVASPLCRT